jgi:hypothetical protein
LREDETLNDFVDALRGHPPPTGRMAVSPYPTTGGEVSPEAEERAVLAAGTGSDLAPEPQPAEPAPPDTTPSPAEDTGVTAEQTVARDILQEIVETRSLGARDRAGRRRLQMLGAESHRPLVDAELRRTIAQLPEEVRIPLTRIVDVHRTDLDAGIAQHSLFLPMLVLTLNRAAIFELRAAADEALRRLRVTVAARVAYDGDRQHSVSSAHRQQDARSRGRQRSERLTPEERRRQQLLSRLAQTCGREFRSQRGYLESLFVALIGRFAYHEWALAPIQEDELDHLSEARDGWQRAFTAGTGTVAPPLPAEIEMYREHETLQQSLDDMQERRSGLEARRRDLLSEIVATRADRSLSRGERREALEAIREQLADVNSDRRELAASVRQARQRQRHIRSRLGGAEGMTAIARYLATSEEERAGQEGVRDRTLDDLRELLNTHRSPAADTEAGGAGDVGATQRPEDVALSAFDDARQASAWTLYLDALTYLDRGDGLAAVEPIQDAFVTRLSRVQARRDLGIEQEFGALSYAGHGLNALDVLIRAEPIPLAERVPGGPQSRAALIRAAFPDTIDLPARALERLPPGTPRRYRLTSSTIRRGQPQTTSGLQDVFGKIAYGLLRPAGQLRTRSDDIAQAFEPREHLATRAPDYVCTPGQHAFEVTRIFSGLAMDNLAVHSPFPPRFDSERRALREALLDAAAQRMDIEDHTTLLVPEFEARRNDPRYGVGSLIRQEHRPRFWREVRQVLEHGCGVPDGLVHRLWRFLFTLRSQGGAALSRNAMSVTITHVYEPTGAAAPRLIVEAYYTHLYQAFTTPGGTVARGAPIGRQGETGNAVSPHLHLEVRLLEELAGRDRAITNLLPHEFFPLRADWTVSP